MMSSLANALLFVALVAASTIVAVMYRKLKRLDAYHAEYKVIFDQTAQALSSAQAAVQGFSQESRDTLVALGAKVEEAKILIGELDVRTAAQS
ncbi:hypothetical protein [Microvirga massiliensis]|uniref:hypothetical protein n=1 Tax=Microvirga massiliensis TaxID=1033741 RepID=UPI00062B722E|nr:hypothetical protein [Microvirga massiliensis]